MKTTDRRTEKETDGQTQTYLQREAGRDKDNISRETDKQKGTYRQTEIIHYYQTSYRRFHAARLRKSKCLEKRLQTTSASQTPPKPTEEFSTKSYFSNVNG